MKQNYCSVTTNTDTCSAFIEKSDSIAQEMFGKEKIGFYLLLSAALCIRPIV